MNALGKERVRHGIWHRTGGFTLGDLENDSLKRLDRRYRRELEDIADGLGDPAKRRYVERQLEAVEAETTLRVLLQERWGAHPRGSDELPAIGPVRPSYWLALVLDYSEHCDGGTSAIDWTPMVEKYDRLQLLDFLGLEGELVLEAARRELVAA